MVPDILFVCGSSWRAGDASPSFVAIGYCVDGCKGGGDLDVGESASCAADLNHGFRGCGETHAPLQEFR